MAAVAVSESIARTRSEPLSFDRFAAVTAILAGVAGFLYAVAFIIIQRSSPALGGGLSALFLTLGGLFATGAVVGVYERLREAGGGFALWALLLSLGGALASLLHGGYDLANAINPPREVNLDLPSQIDPRGLLTFGLAAIGLFVFSWLIGRSDDLPHALGWWGYLSAVLLIVLYVGRLVILNAASPAIVVPALLSGFIVNPVWYVWLGAALWRRH
jgi:hypothetical protein